MVFPPFHKKLTSFKKSGVSIFSSTYERIIEKNESGMQAKNSSFLNFFKFSKIYAVCKDKNYHFYGVFLRVFLTLQSKKSLLKYNLL